MKLSGLLTLLDARPAYRSLLADLDDKIPKIRGMGHTLAILQAARPYILAALSQSLCRPMIVLAARPARAAQLHSQLRHWLPSSNVHLFAEPDPLPYEKVPWSAETTLQRLNALAALAPYFAGPLARKQAGEYDPPLIVGSARSILGMTLPRREFILGLRHLRQGQQINMSRLLEMWVAVGYRPANVVEEPGTFSHRGGIIDLFPPSERWPVRIELFGDEIDSMRQFDPTTQRSIQQIPSVIVAPASEALPKLGPAAAERLRSLDLGNCHPIAANDYGEDVAHLEIGEMIRGAEFYIPYLYSNPGRLLDFLPDEGLLIVEDRAELGEAALELIAQADESKETGIRSGDLPRNFLPALWPWEETQKTLARRLDLELGYGIVKPGGEGAVEDEAETVGEMFSHAQRYGGRLKQIVADCSDMRMAGNHVVLVSRQAKRLLELFQEERVPASEVEQIDEPPQRGTISVLRGVLTEGWVLNGGLTLASSTASTVEEWHPTLLLTDAELFGWSKPVSGRQRRSRGFSPETFFSDVSPGDYVVHIEHGIGIFRGLTKMTLEGIEREYLHIDYAASDRLFVPVHQVDRLARYVGAGEEGPALNRLGTSDWDSLKARTKRAVKDIAKELLALYAARAKVRGHAFQSDTPWQQELEDAFPYVETADQLLAIEEVKADMEQARPMDRLICGDVGYGKTEVALRSAFKAVMDGKQVAVLVPTTVLAQQHYKRFQERLSTFPITVEMLSRFRTERDQERILADLALGRVDIIIGTHRLIQKDVHFKDLGLAIIDEEQRFGVTHKERLKQLRSEVDVLTLTATPIPRTLHLSLTGVRDLSTIDTPPAERLPIKTVLAESDDTLVRQAIVRELERGGQVYFVHNRVRGIEIVARKLQTMVPEAVFAVAHGQMPEKELSQVMWDFSNGEFDVLVCTTIIESGIDIPNVNTIIINRADRFGLSQLYQLRGRVGRGAVRAYAYLLYDKNHPLSEIARRRLAAIVDANELGAGFRIAMEDLEIRGAGEILGARQHGHIAAVGLDLYSRLLSQAIRELQDGLGDERESADPVVVKKREALVEDIGTAQPSVLIDLPLSVLIPTSYVSDEPLRIQLYRRLAETSMQTEIDEIAIELRDRFGALPQEVENLLYQLRVKVSALQLGIQAVVREDGHLAIRAPMLEHLDREGLQRKLGNGPRVGRRQILLPIDDQLVWKEMLTRVLAEMAVSG